MKPKMSSSLDLHCFCQQSCLEIASWDVLQAADYSAYGGRSDVRAGGFAPGAVPEGITLRDAFSGKEDQGPDFDLPWLDFGARAYSPALRRWMTPDPLGEKYPAVNPYAYCAGDPVNYVDPTGEKRRVVINKAKKTITVNATYFVPHMDTRLYRSMKSALSIYNKKFTNFKYNYEGTEYSVRFNLKMSSYYQKKDYINSELNNDASPRNIIKWLNEDKKDEEGKRILSYVTGPGNGLMYMPEGNENILINIHEIGHTLGASDKDSLSDIMYKSLDENVLVTLTQESINEIIEQGKGDMVIVQEQSTNAIKYLYEFILKHLNANDEN